MPVAGSLGDPEAGGPGWGAGLRGRTPVLIVTPGPESALLEGGVEGVDANQVGQREGPSGLGLPRPQTCLPPYQGLGRVSPDSDRTVHSRTWTGWILRAMGTLETLLLCTLLLSPAEAQQGRAPTSGAGVGGWVVGMGLDTGSPSPPLMRNRSLREEWAGRRGMGSGPSWRQPP